MSLQHDDPIDKFMQTADALIVNPPSTCEQVKDIIGPLYKDIPSLRAELVPAKITYEDMCIIAAKMAKLRDRLFMNMCDNYDELGFRESIPMKHPGSAAIAIMAYCSALTILSRNYLDPMEEDKYAFIVKLGISMFESQEKRAFCDYTAHELLKSIWLLSSRWPLLRLTKQDEIMTVFSYLLYLTHRAFVIVGQPHPVEIMDCKVGQYVVQIERSNLFNVTNDLIRRYIDPICRMIAHIRFFMSRNRHESAPLPSPYNEVEMRAGLKRGMRESIDELQKLPTFRQEMRMVFERLCIRHCDFEVFTETCNSDPYEPMIIVMMTKSPEFQTASMRYYLGVDVVSLVENIDETHPEYSSNIDLMTHLHAQNVKLHAAEGHLLKYDVKLRADYVPSEADLLGQFATIRSEKTPKFFTFMGRYHIVAGSELYICEEGVEQAICRWAWVVREHLNGMLKGISVVSGLNLIFGAPRNEIVPGTGAAAEIGWGSGAFI